MTTIVVDVVAPIAIYAIGVQHFPSILHIHLDFFFAGYVRVVLEKISYTNSSERTEKDQKKKKQKI